MYAWWFSAYLPHSALVVPVLTGPLPAVISTIVLVGHQIVSYVECVAGYAAIHRRRPSATSCESEHSPGESVVKQGVRKKKGQSTYERDTRTTLKAVRAGFKHHGNKGGRGGEARNQKRSAPRRGRVTTRIVGCGAPCGHTLQSQRV